MFICAYVYNYIWYVCAYIYDIDIYLQIYTMLYVIYVYIYIYHPQDVRSDNSTGLQIPTNLTFSTQNIRSSLVESSFGYRPNKINSFFVKTELSESIYRKTTRPVFAWINSDQFFVCEVEGIKSVQVKSWMWRPSLGGTGAVWRIQLFVARLRLKEPNI